MEKATLSYEGSKLEVDFDPMTYDNNLYDLWTVAICDRDTDEVLEEEHYTDKYEYDIALSSTYGREVMDEQEEMGLCDIIYDGCHYDCECTYHVAYVIDHEEE